MARRERLYGRHPVLETLRAGRRRIYQLWHARDVDLRSAEMQEILARAQALDLPIAAVERKTLARWVGAVRHQGVVLEVGPYPYEDIGAMWERATTRGEAPLFLLLDTLQDPQNLGSLLRTAEAVGVHGVLLPRRHTVTVTPAVVAASAGASEHLLVGQMNLAQAIAWLQDRQVWVVGLDGHGKHTVDQVAWEKPLALVVGSEGHGLRRLVREQCDLLVRLPMRGQVDSLNAAVAGSVALYFAWQGRGFVGQRDE